jgi:hypothetical protein
MLSALLPGILGAACTMALAIATPGEATAQVRHGAGEYRRPAQVLPAQRPAYRPAQRPAYRPSNRPNYRPGVGRPPAHRPGWAHGRPVPVYPRHHHHHHYYDDDRDDRGSDLGAAIVGGLVAGAVVGIIANGLQEDGRAEPR